MADQRVIDYLKQNSGNYPLDTLKAALRQQGFSDPDIDAAAAEAGLGGPPPAPSAAPGAEPDESDDFIELRPGNAFTNAKSMIKETDRYFAALSPAAPIGPSLGTTIIWSMIAGGVFAVIGLILMARAQRRREMTPG